MGNPDIKSEQVMILEINGQSGLGFRWVSGKLVSMGNFHRP